MTDLSELLERCKAATGPDRRIDAWLNVKLDDPKQWNWQIRDNPDQIGDVSVYSHSAIPPYTASIDAALALVERCLPGWIVDEMGQDAVGTPGSMKAIGWTVELSDGGRLNLHQGQAARAPLAIIEALLKTRQALGEKQ